jgi:hypothetical protein
LYPNISIPYLDIFLSIDIIQRNPPKYKYYPKVLRVGPVLSVAKSATLADRVEALTKWPVGAIKGEGERIDCASRMVKCLVLGVGLQLCKSVVINGGSGVQGFDMIQWPETFNEKSKICQGAVH